MLNKIENKYSAEKYKAIIANYKNMSDEELLDIIRKKTAELGRPPQKSEIPAAYYFKQKYGPWPRVLERAGVKEVSKVYLQKQAARKEKRRRQHQSQKQKKQSPAD